MKFVCCKCLRLCSDKDIVKMPFSQSGWKCYDEWANANPYRQRRKGK